MWYNKVWILLVTISYFVFNQFDNLNKHITATLTWNRIEPNTEGRTQQWPLHFDRYWSSVQLLRSYVHAFSRSAPWKMCCILLTEMSSKSPGFT
jgi:hypothetical protein